MTGQDSDTLRVIGWLEETNYMEGGGGVERRAESLAIAYVTYRRLFNYNGRAGLVMGHQHNADYFLGNNRGLSDVKPEELPEAEVKGWLTGRYPSIYSFVFLPMETKGQNVPFGLVIVTDEEAGKIDRYLQPILERRGGDRYPETGLAIRVNQPYQAGDIYHQKLPTADQMSKTTYEDLLRLGPIGRMDLPAEFWPVYTQACIEMLERAVVLQGHPTANFYESEAMAKAKRLMMTTQLGRECLETFGKQIGEVYALPYPQMYSHRQVSEWWLLYPCADSGLESRRLKAVGDLLILRNYGNCAI